MVTKILNIVKKIEDTILILLLAVIVLTTFLQVLGRFTPLPFSSGFEELATASFLWATMFGASVCVRTGGHICMDLLVSFMPKDKHVYSKIWQYLITFVFSASVLSITSKLIPAVKRAGMVSASLNIPVYFHYYALILGFGLMSFWSIIGIIEQVNLIIQNKRSKNGGLEK